MSGSTPLSQEQKCEVAVTQTHQHWLKMEESESGVNSMNLPAAGGVMVWRMFSCHTLGSVY